MRRVFLGEREKCFNLIVYPIFFYVPLSIFCHLTVLRNYILFLSSLEFYIGVREYCAVHLSVSPPNENLPKERKSEMTNKKQTESKSKPMRMKRKKQSPIDLKPMNFKWSAHRHTIPM